MKRPLAIGERLCVQLVPMPSQQQQRSWVSFIGVEEASCFEIRQFELVVENTVWWDLEDAWYEKYRTFPIHRVLNCSVDEIGQTVQDMAREIMEDEKDGYETGQGQDESD